MGAPVASGTLAGSTSGSRTSIHKEAASSDFSRFGRHPSGRPTRTTLSAVAGSDGAIGCVGSTQFGGRRRSRPLVRRDCRNRGIARAPPEQAGEPKQSCRAQAACAWMRRSRQRGRLVLGAVDGASDAYAPPGRRRSAAHFRFRLGRRAAVVARDRGDRPRVVGVAQSRRRQHRQRWPEERDFRSGGEHQLDVGRSAVPRLVPCGSGHRRPPSEPGVYGPHIQEISGRGRWVRSGRAPAYVIRRSSASASP